MSLATVTRIELDPADPFTMQWEEKLIDDLLEYANMTRNEGETGFDLLLNVQGRCSALS